MTNEWQVVVVIAALLGAVAAARFMRSDRLRVSIAISLIGLVTISLVLSFALRQRPIAEADVLGRPIQVDADGYVGSEACRACHAHEHQTWHDSYHRKMTQIASKDSVLGDFDDVNLLADGEEYHLDRDGDQFWVEQPDPFAQAGSTPKRVRSRIVVTTGSHNMQAYWFETGHTRNLGLLPFTWHVEDQKWQTRRSAFVGPASDPHTTRMGNWNIICLKCHSTHARPRILTEGENEGAAFTRIAEFGISCESCHGPAAEHIAANQNPARRYMQRLSGEPDPTIVNPARLDPMLSTQVCGSCHSDLEYDFNEQRLQEWLKNGFRYRPGDDLRKHYRPDFSGEDQFWSDGLIRVAGREYNALLKSDCHEEGGMSCLTCHAMHQANDDPRPRAEWASDQLHSQNTDQTCMQCHPQYAEDIPSHTHHAADSIGSSCMNCHMPHSTYGLMKGVRTHRIESPSVQVTLKTGRPNACNLCHLDQTLEWTAKALNNWYGTPVPELSEDARKISTGVQWLLKGDAALRALIAWGFGWRPAQDTAGTEWMAPYLAEMLVDPYESVRIIGQRALRSLPGFAAFEHDLTASAEARAAAKREALSIWSEQQAGKKLAGSARARVLLADDGNVIAEAFARLLKRRDNKLIRLFE
jgi:formate-dependent nitrite reductase cytochrome c552 subunit